MSNLDFKPQHENLVLQVILNAVNDEGMDYLDTDAGREWMDLIGINADVAKLALEATEGKVKDIRYINEHLDE